MVDIVKSFKKYPYRWIIVVLVVLGIIIGLAVGLTSGGSSEQDTGPGPGLSDQELVEQALRIKGTYTIPEGVTLRLTTSFAIRQRKIGPAQRKTGSVVEQSLL